LSPVVCRADIPRLRPRLQHPEHRGIGAAHKSARDPDYDEGAVSAAMKKPEITLKVALGLGKGRDRVLTCDLTKEYMAVNGDYRS
jgi:glutamate N-acetyltransferase/amino-acid N-acetyltransferase